MHVGIGTTYVVKYPPIVNGYTLGRVQMAGRGVCMQMSVFPYFYLHNHFYYDVILLLSQGV